MAWKTISSKTLFTHPRIALVEDTVELPDGSQTSYLVYGGLKDAASVICIEGDEVLLQKEYAYPTGEALYQFPGGKIEDGETSEEGAFRELIEESGLKAKELTKLGWFYFDNRRSNAKLHVYVSTDCEAVEKKGGDREESITSHWVPIREVDDMIRKGEIVNYSLLASWAMYKASL